MITINNKSATYAYTTSAFNSGRGMAVTFTRSGDADACQLSGDYKTSTLNWASNHENVDIRNSSAFPIDYHCWYYDSEGTTVQAEFTGTLAAGEEKRVTTSKKNGVPMLGVFTGASVVTIYGAPLS